MGVVGLWEPEPEPGEEVSEGMSSRGAAQVNGKYPACDGISNPMLEALPLTPRGRRKIEESETMILVPRKLQIGTSVSFPPEDGVGYSPMQQSAVVAYNDITSPFCPPCTGSSGECVPS